MSGYRLVVVLDGTVVEQAVFDSAADARTVAGILYRLLGGEYDIYATDLANDEVIFSSMW